MKKELLFWICLLGASFPGIAVAQAPLESPIVKPQQQPTRRGSSAPPISLPGYAQQPPATQNPPAPSTALPGYEQPPPAAQNSSAPPISLPGYAQQPPAIQNPPAPSTALPGYEQPPASAQNPALQSPSLSGYARQAVSGGEKVDEHYGSTYVPVDSWIYPAMSRLYSLGYANTMFISMRPWTRQTILHMLQASEDDIRNSDDVEAKQIFVAVLRYVELENTQHGTRPRGIVYGLDSGYTRILGISGQTLRDSYHLGQTIVNDYGRPYAPGFNTVVGFSSTNEWGRLSLNIRGEYQHTPATAGYSLPLASFISTTYDQISYSGYNRNQATIPEGNIPAQDPFRLIEATLSVHWGGTEFSGGKSDAWLGPAQGGALAWSNNAENIYSFRINRVDPLRIPLVSRLLGPMRYDFFYGSLKGHTAPNNDYTDSVMFSFKPTKNFEFAFQRTIIFGGQGHEPVTFHNFLKGFVDLADTTPEEKFGRNDPGARFSDFSMSWRLPFVRNYVTFYADSIAHDDVTPPSAPRRAAFRTGLYLSHIPGLRKADFRIEAADTDPITSRSTQGTFTYYETVQRQGYTNKGFIMGDWIGREAKGGQAWFTYHLSGNEFVQIEFLNKKTDKDFAPGSPNPLAYNGFNAFGGTTQNQLKALVVKRFMHDNLQVNAWFQYEKWNVPAYRSGVQHDTATAIQVTYFPGLKHLEVR